MKAVSRFAFTCSVATLFREAVSGVSLWTLTFPGVGVHTWAVASRAWELFRKRSSRGGQPLHGVRVAELHPGGHGWHLHYLTDLFHPVEGVRHRAESVGFGRVNVIYLGERDAGMALYLAKHFRKDFRSGGMGGGHRWRTVGGFRGTRVSDVEVQSSFRDWLRIECLRRGWRRVTFDKFWRLRVLWLCGPPRIIEKSRRALDVSDYEQFTSNLDSEAERPF